MHLLPCPNCQETTPVSPSQAGDKTRCKACDASIDIPKLGELRQLPLAQQDGQIDASVEKRGENSAGRQMVSTLLGIVALLAFVTAAYCGFRWASIKPESSTKQHLADVQERYPTLETAKLIREFEDMETASLDMPAPYNYKVVEMEKTREGKKATFAGIIALITSVLSIVIASTGRTSDN